jgi:hypothetical protein
MNFRNLTICEFDNLESPNLPKKTKITSLKRSEQNLMNFREGESQGKERVRGTILLPLESTLAKTTQDARDHSCFFC